MVEIVPAGAPYPNAALGFDGTAYRVLAVNEDGAMKIEFEPEAHSETHENGGDDEISLADLDGAPAEKAAANGLASLDGSTKVVEQPASITDHLEGSPTEDEAAKAPTSEWAFDHDANAAAHHVKTTDASQLSSGSLPTARLLLGTEIIMIAASGSPPNAVIDGTLWFESDTGKLYRCQSTNWVLVIVGPTAVSITFIIDGGGEEIADGQHGHLEIPFACTITRVTALADQSGSIVVDLWVDSYANFPPDNTDSITASAPVTISTAVKSQDSTLSGWDTGIAAGDVLAYNVDSCTDIERVTISLKVTKT